MPLTFDFPPELERLIFERAFIEYRAIQLTRVSRQVQSWIEPLLYAKLMLFSWSPIKLKLLMRTVTSRPATFFTANVKCVSLCAYDTAGVLGNVATVIGKCRDVESIVLWVPGWWSQFPPSSLMAPRLTRLTTYNLPSGSVAVFRKQLFQHITHLAFNASISNEGFIRQQLHHLDCLTHLACSISSLGFEITRWQTTFQEVLCKCRRLQVLWFICKQISVDGDTDIALRLAGKFKDDRVVCYGEPGLRDKIVSGELAIWEIPEKIAKQQRVLRDLGCLLY